MDIYVVREGDTVDEIAAMFSVPVYRIISDNQMVYPYRMAVGQALLIRQNGDFRNQGEERPVLLSAGYAYPFISRWVLEETLPYLSRLLVFSYGFTSEGDLIPPLWDDTWMIETAKNRGVSPFLVLTPLDSTGHFNNNLVTIVVQNQEVQQHLIRQLWETVSRKGYEGVDIDFEYVRGEDRDSFTRFVENVRNVLNVFGYPVSVALAPKTSGDQPGLLYEGMDYGGLGRAANDVLLMTYEWGYSRGPNMAVAPINMVRRVVEYALTEIPAEKILLGIPNYGYDWPLPYERGVTIARTLGNVEAVQQAIEFGVPIQFDETAQSPYYRYWQYGVQHEVWFEDVRSILAKFNLIREYGLTGAGYWQIMQFFKANWLLMEQMFQILR